MTVVPREERFEVIDALRGFALFGLFSIHMLEHYNLFVFPPSEGLLKILDPWTQNMLYFLFAGKAYAIFAFLFGMSFYIQMNNQAKKGVNFNGRFLWRLCILAVIGFLHGLLYAGDILMFFATLGVSLLVFNRFSSKVLFVLGILLLLQLPAVYQLLQMLFNPTYTPSDLLVLMGTLYEASTPVFTQGSFYDVLAFDWFNGKAANWLYMLLYGRVYQTLGLFTFGIILGRIGFFAQPERYRVQLKRALLISVAVFIPLFTLGFYLPSLFENKTAGEWAGLILASYSNLAFMICLLSGGMLLYLRYSSAKAFDLLKPVGRMSLTNYVLQSVVCIPIFFGFGLGLYDNVGFFYSFLLGIFIFTIQIIYSKWWLKNFFYGPLEWIWRSLTYINSKKIPFRKP